MALNLEQLQIDKTYCNHEAKVLHIWKETKLYEKIQQKEQTKLQTFKFMDGPPFASGTLHMGHECVAVVKDTILKHKRKMNFNCTNKLGYDTHGLPIETAVCKNLILVSKAQIEEIGISKFNKICKETINSYMGSWEPLYDIIGRWANFKDVYKTMDINYMETVWWCFNEMWKKDLVFKGFKVMPYSYACQTPLSNFEATQNYKEIVTRSIYVYFELVDVPNRGLVAWTTTPWTLLSNVALCVNPDIQYVLCTDEFGREYIIGETSINNLNINFTTCVSFKKGKDMVGMKYKPIYSYLDFSYHQVIADNFVQDSGIIGSCIVHIAPAFGDDDCRVCLDNGIVEIASLNKLCPIDEEGKYIDIMGCYDGMLVFDADKLIIKELKQKNIAIHEQHYTHQYPFCYRTDTPLIYKASSSFFIDVPKIKDRMIELNKTINWTPKTIGENRFNNWLENVKPWCVSRNRYFGTPIPVWITEDGEEMMSIGSIDELMKYAVNLPERPLDLHPEYINDVILKSPKTGKTMKRILDIFDCWFESGAVPYGELHYPFENKEKLDNACHGEYLSDFISEGLDQTRGWFYTLLVLSTAISNKAPFKNVICTGLVLDAQGIKFSKKFGNFVDPTILIQKYGADIIRLYLLGSSIVRAEPLHFCEQDIVLLKQRIIPYINANKFFLEHCIAQQKSQALSETKYQIKYLSTNININELNIIDKWILELTGKLRIQVIKYMEEYQIDKAVYEIINYIDDLTNWYIKLNRDRLKGLCGQNEWYISLSVLYTVLMDYILIASPFMPFLSEYLYSKLHIIDIKEFPLQSCHEYIYTVRKTIKFENHDYNIIQSLSSLEKTDICLYSKYDIFDSQYFKNIETSTHSSTIEQNMQNIHNYNISDDFKRIQNIVKMIRNIRDTSITHTSCKIPIKKITVYHHDTTFLDSIKVLIDYVHDEVNCIEFDFELFKEEQNYYQIKPNNKMLGQKFRKDMKTIKAYIDNLNINRTFENQNLMKNFLLNQTLEITISDKLLEKQIILNNEDIEIITVTNRDENKNIKYMELDNILITADLTYDDITHNSYQVRKFIATIQNTRKLLGLRPWNKIQIYVNTLPKDIDDVLLSFNTYILARLNTTIETTMLFTDMQYNFEWEFITEAKHNFNFSISVL